MDEPTNEPSGMVYPRYQLGDDLQPRVNVYDLNALHQCFVNIGEVAIVKPKGQQSARKD